MEIKNFYTYLKELQRCEWHDNAIANGIKYNGITIEQGRETYQQRLDVMQAEAEETLLQLLVNGQIKAIKIIYDKAIALREKPYDIINQESVEALKREFPLPRTEAIKGEILLGQFVIDMHSLQLCYMEKLITFISSLLDCNTTTVKATDTQSDAKPIPIAKETDNDNNKHIIRGVDGLAKYLDFGSTKAQAVLNSGILQDKGIAYRCGKDWRINAEKLDNLLAKEPYIFKGTLKKRNTL